MRLTLKEIEARLVPLGGRPHYDRQFIFDLLLAYGRSQGNVTRLSSMAASSLNVAADPNTEVAQKKVLYFKELPESSEEALLAAVEELSSSTIVIRYNTRFVIVTDYRTLLAKDTKTGDTLTTAITDIADHFTFFLPWAGMEKAQFTAEAHADIKAAERMAKLFDELIKLNPEANQTQLGRHALNIFFTRLLFCFFAEDTGIFAEDQFTAAVESLTQPDGSDMDDFLKDLFVALDTASTTDKPKHLAGFPFVNGQLFAVKEGQGVPVFNKKARDYLLESGKLLWSEINPDIFGSMFQAIVTPGQRSDLGQHYTSVPNILKTIEPLFLDELKEQLDADFDSEKKLIQLLNRIAQIKIFDPACGSGNFLIIAYKELRKLEHEILERLQEIQGGESTFGLLGSRINIENFYGIEIDGFAVEVAILSMWIAKHQMNIEFKEKFGTDIPLIPLKEMGHFTHGNAARIDWQSVCPNDGQSEIYLIGNPPYKGSKNQTKDMKHDFPYVFGSRAYSKNLDYIALWFVKGADYITGTRAELAFVSTNSVSQGEHVGLMFPMLFGIGVEVGYAYTSFKWENNAKKNAGVTVVVINLRTPSSRPKYIFTDGIRQKAENINGYLANFKNIVVHKSNRRLFPTFPKMGFGNMALDGSKKLKIGLSLTAIERDAVLRADSSSATYIRRFVGADEFIDGKDRWCLWIRASEYHAAQQNVEIQRRIKSVKKFRESSSDASTKKAASRPYSFREQREPEKMTLVIPRTSSELRKYIPIGYTDKDVIVSDAINAAFDAAPWVMGLLSSRMHMIWVRAVAGALESRIRYSATIVYNNFPVPPLSEILKKQLADKALRVLDVREYHSELTLADLYDPDKMPGNLRQAHQGLDDLVDSIYRKREFGSDEERLSLLFEMYSQMSEAEVKK